MDFVLENPSEEDPLFDSIMNAMNSMKEATADKIYQKIQKEGETNYSKPQVDRALASALKYGIFEMKNNRYRVRDDVLDDEDTVYWKLQKKREQTPFRIQDNNNDRTFGPKLDPEKDNLRFRKISNEETSECPQCGRMKRPLDRPKSAGRKFKHGKGRQKRKTRNKKQAERIIEDEKIKEKVIKVDLKRKKQSDSISPERPKKLKQTNLTKENRNVMMIEQKHLKDAYDKAKTKNHDDDVKDDKFESDSENNSLSSHSDEENSNISCPENEPMKYRRYNKPHSYTSEHDGTEELEKNLKPARRSSTSLKSDSDSDKSEASSDHSSTRGNNSILENLPCSSRNGEGKDLARNQYLNSEMYPKQYGRGQKDERKTDWIGGCSEEPQGTIIQSNNVLTIEPMDSLAFKSSEQASYIS